MSDFEKQKNTKAAAYTILLLGSLLLLFFVISWAPPVAPHIEEEEGMEVNLGDSESGEGEVQPLEPGEPAVEEIAVPASSTPLPPAQTEDKAVETNDEDKEAPPAVVKSPIQKPKEKTPVKPVLNNSTKSTPNSNSASPQRQKENSPVQTPPINNPAPSPKPKYVLKAQEWGQGGNNAESSQASAGQGVAGGKGDQGKPNGDLNAAGYTGSGGSGSGGISISRGLQGRKINRFPSFQDDFNENAKVAVDIKVDKNGNVIGASIQPRGTTTANAGLKSIALQKAKQLKFTSDEDGAEEQLGTVLFDFRVRN